MTIRAGALVDVADFGSATQQVVPLIGGVTDADVTAWLLGGLAGIEFSCALGTVVHNTLIGTWPAGLRPTRLVTVVLTPNSTIPASAFVQIATTGEMMFYMYGGGAAATRVRGSSAWPRVVP